jgi:hypothetical protein
MAFDRIGSSSGHELILDDVKAGIVSKRHRK